MTTNVNPNPSDGASTFPPRATQVPTKPGTVEKEGEGADKVADRMAHKGAKDEQNFDRDNNRLFSK